MRFVTPADFFTGIETTLGLNQQQGGGGVQLPWGVRVGVTSGILYPSVVPHLCLVRLLTCDTKLFYLP